jgi:hypothetical protein
MISVRGNIGDSEGGYYLWGRCEGVRETGIHVVYPGDQWGAVAPFRLVRNAALKKLEHYLEAEPVKKVEPDPNVIGIYASRRYCKVEATVIGRFDAVGEEDILVGKGFGNGGRSRFQLVLHKVIRPTAHECTRQQ